MKWIALLAMLAAPPAMAMCGDRAMVVERAATAHGEKLQFYGLAPVMEDGEAVGVNLLEVYSNPETGSWTAVVTGEDGTACMVAFGTDFTPAKIGAPI